MVLTISAQKHRFGIASHSTSTIAKRNAETYPDIHGHGQSQQELSATWNLILSVISKRFFLKATSFVAERNDLYKVQSI